MLGTLHVVMIAHHHHHCENVALNYLVMAEGWGLIGTSPGCNHCGQMNGIVPTDLMTTKH